MKIIARGYTHWDAAVAPDPVTVVTLDSMDDYEALVCARNDLWWVPEVVDVVPRRWLGYAVAVVALLAVLGIAGWIEGLS